MGVCSVSDTAVLRPRWYFPANPCILSEEPQSPEHLRTITPTLMEGPSLEANGAEALKGLQAKCVYGTYTPQQVYNLGNIEFTQEGTIKNIEEVEQINLSQVRGTPPGMPNLPINHRNLWAYIPEYIAGLGNAQWVSTLPNTAHLQSNPAVQGPLWQIIGNRIWQVIAKPRLAIRVTLHGTGYLLNPFFSIPSWHNRHFRIRTASVDYLLNTTTLTVLEC